MSGLRTIGGDVEGALERVNVPAYVIDATGVIRWLNPAALGIVGDVPGPETVRNHVRAVLRALGVHSRLEAVALARRWPVREP